MQVKIRAYTSPTLVLLAFDWEPGAQIGNFLGFAIQRTPGFAGQLSSWLPNRINFDGPSTGGDLPSDQAPIQKFLWWDARIDTPDRGATINYRVVPVLGAPGQLQLDNTSASALPVRVPQLIENGIGVYFNRAVMSSQAFSRHFPALETLAQIKAANTWLANGIETAIPDYLSGAASASAAIEGAIYHLNDDFWTIPALEDFPVGDLSLVYNSKSDDTESDAAIQTIINAGHPAGQFVKRTKGNIMHNKFLVRLDSNQPQSVLTGSANFTTAGLTRQANVLHTIESPKLAKLYLERKRALEGDPTMGTLAAQAGWSNPVDDVTGQIIRVFFSPEKKIARASIDTVINAVRAADSSVIFCCFMPTDLPLINACLDTSADGRMMFGMVDNIREPSASDPSFDSKIVLFHRSRDQRDVVGKEVFDGDAVPLGFAPERAFAPDEDPIRSVRIHHKFVLIDAETDEPTLYTGSANMSNNSIHNNDENLLEITGNRALSAAYLAEFLRLYEHYRARLFFVRSHSGQGSTFKLTPNGDWSAKYFLPNSPEFRARKAMAA